MDVVHAIAISHAEWFSQSTEMQGHQDIRTCPWHSWHHAELSSWDTYQVWQAWSSGNWICHFSICYRETSQISRGRVWMSSSTPELWEAPGWDLKAPLQDATPGGDVGHGTHWQHCFLEAALCCQEGLPAWSFFIMCQDVCSLATTPGDSHHRNCSFCLKVRLLEDTHRPWSQGLLGSPHLQMGWNHEAQAHFQMSHP